uniref:Reverse transcriptase domain-containing protein n=1 Tax=Cannabis sativa TaxID=3483 RepID=A0A803QEQ4_CANSA
MLPDKSPDLDGMTLAFYQKCWSIIKNDAIKVVQQFFQTGVFAEDWSVSNIVLIPKKKSPEHMTDLRLIALSNVLHKIITKVITNRMKPIMDLIVSELQSAFIPGRLITDNIMVFFEVLHYLKRKRQGKVGFMAMKLDMSKAYDCIKLIFLESMLCRLGFDQWWIHLLLQCVTSTRYMVTHNGRAMGSIIPTRGIRQGDPLSPYPFIICAKGLPALLKKYEHRGWLHGYKVVNGAPRVSHLLFADDSYLYSKATEDETLCVQELLGKFEEVSGQKVNHAKSSIFYSSNTTTVVQDRVSTLLELHSKHVNVSSLCPVCQSKDETILHRLVSCPEAVLCWNRVRIGTRSTRGKARKDLMWKEKVMRAGDIVVSAKRYLDQWRHAQNSNLEVSWPGIRGEATSKAGDGAKHWILLQINSIKINVDASMFERENGFGFGMVARDSNGFLIEVEVNG